MQRLENDSLILDLTPCAAAIHRLTVKHDGRQIVYPLENEEAHLSDPSYANDTIGCYAGRIRNASLTIDGNSYSLDANDGKNSLHGGTQSLARKIWKAENQNAEETVYSTTMEDEEDGLPGNRNISVRYRLLPDGLSITYKAKSDKRTYLDVTNHLYLNLSGDFSHSVEDHLLAMDAPFLWLNDDSHLPKEQISTKETNFDFTHGSNLGNAMKDPLVAFSHGLNNAFLWKGEATLSYDGLSVCLMSGTPSLVLYSGGYLPDPSTAIALEAQQLPDAPNLRKDDDSLFLAEGTTWERTINLTIGKRDKEGLPQTRQSLEVLS